MWEEYEGKPRRHWIDADYIFIVLVLASIIIHIIGEILGITNDHINTTQSYTTEISNEDLTDTSIYTINNNNKYIVVKEIEDDMLVIVKEDKK